MVETALVLPLLLLIIFGIIEIGIAFNRLLLITAAAREGCRLAVVGDSNTQITDRIAQIAPFLTPTNSTVTLNPPNVTQRVPDSTMIVTIAYTHAVMTPLVGSVLGVSIPLNASTTMRVE